MQAGLALAVNILLCLPPLRRPSYELFLRTHQVLSLFALYTVWKHVWGSTKFAQYYLTGVMGCFTLNTVGQILSIVLLNKFFYRGFPRAQISRVGGTVSLWVYTPTLLHIRPGQYINVYLPGVSSWSFLQSHPFYVSFARHEDVRFGRYEGKGTRLELVIDPRRGWTSKLFNRAQHQKHTKSNTTLSQLPLCFFSGPHGDPVHVENYGVVVLVASGWGITALMPYLQALIFGFHNSTVKAQRVHLIWQLGNTGRFQCGIHRSLFADYRSGRSRS